jgi:hypothetical protein
MAGDKPEEGPVEHVAVTGRPQDEPLPNTTLAERAKARAKAAQAGTTQPAPKKASKK